MQISDKGLKLILEFEGKHKLLPDGRYQAYRCQIGQGMDDGVWTIYAGVTEGVYGGMIVTEDEGQRMFKRELARFEAAVNRLVTVPMTQGQYDALVSFSYNCGDAALARSSILAKLNAGDVSGAARAFAPWNRSRGIVVPGLVRRRAAEAAMFLEPDAQDGPSMPQSVSPPPTTVKTSRKAKAADAGAAAASASALALGGIGVADAIGYAGQIAQFTREYGWPLAIGFAAAGAVLFLAIKYWQQQDYDEGRYLPVEVAE